MNWAEQTLGEICKPKQWKTIPKKKMQAEGFPVYGANGQIGFFGKFTHEDPVILIGCRGSCGQVHITPPMAYANGNAMALDNLNHKITDIRYLFHFLMFRGFNDVITGTSQPQIIRQNIIRIKVPLPPLSEQKRIAAILDKANALQEKRRQAIAKLGDLLKSVFLDMFGDPMTNPKGWELYKFKDLIEKGFHNGLSPSKKGTVPAKVLTLSAVTQSPFDEKNIKEAVFESLPDNKFVDKRDFLICRGNGNLNLVGRGKFPKRSLRDTLFPDTMIAARINQNKIMPFYLEVLWDNSFIRDQIERSARTTNGTYKINQKALESLILPTPPIGLQSKYSSTASKIKKQQETFIYSQDRLDELFASLQQRVFKGEL